MPARVIPGDPSPGAPVTPTPLAVAVAPQPLSRPPVIRKVGNDFCPELDAIMREQMQARQSVVVPAPRPPESPQVRKARALLQIAKAQSTNHSDLSGLRSVDEARKRLGDAIRREKSLWSKVRSLLAGLAGASAAGAPGPSSKPGGTQPSAAEFRQIAEKDFVVHTSKGHDPHAKNMANSRTVICESFHDHPAMADAVTRVVQAAGPSAHVTAECVGGTPSEQPHRCFDVPLDRCEFFQEPPCTEPLNARSQLVTERAWKVVEWMLPRVKPQHAAEAREALSVAVNDFEGAMGMIDGLQARLADEYKAQGSAYQDEMRRQDADLAHRLLACNPDRERDYVARIFQPLAPGDTGLFVEGAGHCENTNSTLLDSQEDIRVLYPNERLRVELEQSFELNAAQTYAQRHAAPSAVDAAPPGAEEQHPEL
jgi:hypothetical protein